MAISNKLKAIYATAPANDFYIETLQILHPKLSGGSFAITNHRDGFSGIIENGATMQFIYLPFGTIPPKTEEGGNLTLQVALDNTSRELMDELELMATEPETPIVIVYRVFLNSDNTIQNDPPLRLDVTGVSASSQAISFNAGLANLRNKPFPAQLYKIANYPGLAR
mgnify:FL=1|tara:strand:- start:44 stop:544 length:501 start_codon:yes stop_codon:yes gene_type:complete